MAKLGLQAPWEIYYSELNELFRRDSDISVIFDEEEFEIKMYVDNKQKAEILERVLPSEVDLGRKLPIIIIPNNNAPLFEEAGNDWEILFRDNDAVSYIHKVDVAGFRAIYIVFENRVVQYFTDNLSDINGFTSTLYQDIAKRIINVPAGVFFCTDAAVGENTSFGMPIADWP